MNSLLLLLIDAFPIICITYVFFSNYRKLILYRKYSSLFGLFIIMISYTVLRTRWIINGYGTMIPSPEDLIWTIQESLFFVILGINTNDLLCFKNLSSKILNGKTCIQKKKKS